jgi:hypothetical protein
LISIKGGLNPFTLVAKLRMSEMESTSQMKSPPVTEKPVPDKSVTDKPVTEKIVREPGQVETVQVEGAKGKVVEGGSLVADTSKDAGHEVVKDADKASDVVVDASKKGVSDVVESGKKLEKDARHPMPVSPTPPTRSSDSGRTVPVTKTP